MQMLLHSLSPRRLCSDSVHHGRSLLHWLCMQAEKLSSLGDLGKEKSAKTLADSEKLLQETVKHCEEMLAAAQVALEGMRSRWGGV